MYMATILLAQQKTGKETYQSRGMSTYSFQAGNDISEFVRTILKDPELLDSKKIQKSLSDTLAVGIKAGDYKLVYDLLNAVQVALTPRLLNSCSTQTLRLVDTLKKTYFLVTKLIIADLKSQFAEGAREKNNPFIPTKLSTAYNLLREVQTDFKESYFGSKNLKLASQLEKLIFNWHGKIRNRLQVKY